MSKTGLLILIVVSLLSGGCNKRGHYSLRVSSTSANADSIKLYLYEPDYNSVRLIGEDAISATSNYVEFSGLCESPGIAYLCESNDTIKYYFQLDSIPTSMEIGQNSFKVLKGSDDNIDIIIAKGDVMNMVTHRSALIKEYNMSISDSTLTAAKELRLLNEIKITTEQIDSIILEKVAEDTPKGYLSWLKFGKYLTKAKVPEKYKK